MRITSLLFLSITTLVVLTLGARLPAQRAACFEEGPALPWAASNVGDLKVAASRTTAADAFELCSISNGFGPTADQLRFLYLPARSDVDALARLDSLTGAGLGGVMVRLDVRTANYAYLQISASRSPTGALVLTSSFRLNAGEASSDGGIAPVRIDLPVWLRVRREGVQMATSYSRDGRDFREHLRIEIASSHLEELFLQAGMVQASGGDLAGTTRGEPCLSLHGPCLQVPRLK